MGKIAERLALRKTPDFQLVLRALQLGVAARYDDEADDALAELMEQQLATRTPAQFDAWMGCLMREAHAAGQGDSDLLEDLELQVQHACMVAAVPDNPALDHYLVALPFLMTGAKSACHLALPADASERIGSTLQAHGVVAESAQVVVLPRILSSSVAACLPYGTLFRVLRALAEGDKAGALGLVEAGVRMRGGATQSGKARQDDAPEVASSGVLMAVVTAEFAGAFPLEEAFLAAVGDMDLPADPSEADAEESRQMGALLAEQREVLQCVAAELAPWMGVREMIFLGTLSTWFDDVAQLISCEREMLAHGAMRRVADAHAGGDLSQVYVDEDMQALEEEEGNGVRLPLRHVATHAQLGYLSWPALPGELVEEALAALVEFLNSSKVQGSSSQDVQQARLLVPGAVPTGRRLH